MLIVCLFVCFNPAREYFVNIAGNSVLYFGLCSAFSVTRSLYRAIPAMTRALGLVSIKGQLQYILYRQGGQRIYSNPEFSQD